MSGSSLRVDLLLHSLKEIQQEKCCLENKLDEQKRKRSELEATLDSVNSKFQQVKDVHEKMSETLKVAQHKVVETQYMADSSEEMNCQIRKSIADLNNEIDAEKDRQMDDIQRFEDQLSDLADYLCKAKSVYDDKILQQGITEAETQKLQLEKKVTDYADEYKDLEKALEQLSISKNVSEQDIQIPVDLRKDVWSACKEENVYIQEILQQANEILKDFELTLSSLEETLSTSM